MTADKYVIETTRGTLYGPFDTPAQAVAWVKREVFTWHAIRPVSQPVITRKST